MIRSSLISLGLVLATAGAASAQWYPGQQSGYANRPVQTQGVVASTNWYDLQLAIPNGRTVYVRLHQGTIINPRGTTLQNGMPVRVIGYVDNGGTLQANEIDVTNNRNCGGNSGYYGSGQYGTGYYNNGNGNGQCRGRGWRKHRGDGDDNEDRDDNRDGDNGNRNPYAYPNPYPTYHPQE